MSTTKGRTVQGVRLRLINYIMAGITLLISVFLLVTTAQTAIGYNQLKRTSDEYIECETAAKDMQAASDYLTEQVRYFAETGERVYVNAYFTEAKETRRRDKALETINRYFGDDDLYAALQGALSGSVALMEKEYCSMRLMAEAMGDDLSTYPEEVQNADASAYAALTPAEKEDLAREKVFDEEYKDAKRGISEHVKACLDGLTENMKERQETASRKLSDLLLRERVLIVLLILAVILTATLTTVMVLAPLIHAVPKIQEEKTIPVTGAYEVRFLAKTYNQMVEASRQSKARLSYEASHDHLTGVYNRGGFDRLLNDAAEGENALLLVDVDGFKAINDKYGHVAGDKALLRVTAGMKSVFRSGDRICRIGGDEFAVIMRDTGPDHRDAIREKVDRLNALLQTDVDGLPPVSVSVGVAFGGHGDGTTLFRVADEQLYHVKQSGRCGCSFYVEGEEIPEGTLPSDDIEK